MPSVRIESVTKELRPLRGSQDTTTLYTGWKINGQWVNIKGDYREGWWKKIVDIEEVSPGVVRLSSPQQTPQAETPPPPPPPQPSMNGHKPRWANREDALDAYIFYATRLEEYIKEPYALVKATNCLVMIEKDGEINPVHRRKDSAPAVPAQPGWDKE